MNAQAEETMTTKEQTAPVFDTRRCSLTDGPGVRTTFFFKGCNLRCAWCHNPESQQSARRRLYYQSRCTGCGVCLQKCPAGALGRAADGTILYDEARCTLCGRCGQFCPQEAISLCGEEKTVEELMQIARRDIAYYGEEGGVTASGGECLLYPDFMAALFAACRRENIGTAADTAGNVPWAAFERVLPVTDLFLYDIKCVSPALCRQYIGADGALILENYRRLKSAGARVTVRIPVIPELHLENGEPSAEFLKMAQFLREAPPEAIELLPYHRLGEHKYAALGLDEPPSFRVPTEEEMAALRQCADGV